MTPTRKKRKAKAKAVPKPTPRPPFDDSRKRVEDAVIEYAKAYGSFCCRLSTEALTEKRWQSMLSALEAHERLCAKGGKDE